MNFTIDSSSNLGATDVEIFQLLSKVYVDAGFTTEKVAKNIFDPYLVRRHGFMFVSREQSNNEFAGMIIVVPPGSPSIVRAQENECEIHLLGVKPEYRGYGLGRRLVSEAIDFSDHSGWSKIVLWTQKPMKEAQKLYESFGFKNIGGMVKNNIEFLVYERECT